MRNFEKIEIERKWILSGNPLEAESSDRIIDICQKYCSDGWRYRISHERNENTYSRTRKTPVGLGSNVEVEEEITVKEWDDAGDGKFLSKRRLVYNRNGLKFEVDLFNDIHLIIMEVELDSIDQPIEIPKFLQDLIIYEVTGINQFSNSSLSK